MPPKTCKERSHEYRDTIRNDPERHEAYKKRERERYLRRKESGSRKVVCDMTNREHRSAKKNWRAAAKKYRINKRNEENALRTQATPPTSPPSPPSPRRAVGRKKVK